MNDSQNNQYTLTAYSTLKRIKLKGLKQLLNNGRIERYNQDCVISYHSDQELIFIFNFGSVVFFNIAHEKHTAFLSKLGVIPEEKKAKIEDSDCVEDDFKIRIGEGQTQVAFHSVTIPSFELAKIHLIALVLAKSNALEVIENRAEEFIELSEKMTADLKKTGFVSKKRHKLTKFLGEGLSTKHHIINQLALLDPPEKTWEKEDLHDLYYELHENFEIADRIETVEKMFALSFDAAQLLLEIHNTKRGELLEIIIILLIALEVLIFIAELTILR